MSPRVPEEADEEERPSNGSGASAAFASIFSVDRSPETIRSTFYGLLNHATAAAEDTAVFIRDRTKDAVAGAAKQAEKISPRLAKTIRNGGAQLLRHENAVVTQLGDLNVQAAVAYLDVKAGGHSKRKCAKYVRLALERGGVNLKGHPVDAADYKGFLDGRRDFERINLNSWVPQPGDVVVFDRNRNHPDGHIEMCLNDGRFASDYKGGLMPWHGAQYTVYRHASVPSVQMASAPDTHRSPNRRSLTRLASAGTAAAMPATHRPHQKPSGATPVFQA